MKAKSPLGPDDGLDGFFEDDDADPIISLVRSFNETVEAEFGAA